VSAGVSEAEEAASSTGEGWTGDIPREGTGGQMRIVSLGGVESGVKAEADVRPV
jgi:hypothetical protein